MSDKSITRLIIFAVIVVIALVLSLNSCSIVPPGHRGVQVTLGKVSSDVKSEGLNFKPPFISSIKKISIQQQAASGNASCFSSDLQTCEIQFAVLYKIPSNKVVELYQQFAGNPYQNLVEPRLQGVMKQIVARFKAEEVVKNRERIKTELIDLLSREVQGMVTIVDVPIKNIDLTDQLEKAIEDKQVQEQQALAKRYELQKAEKQAEITIVQAKAEAEAVRIKGKAVAENPKVIDLEIATKWDGKSPTSVVVSEGGANVILPLK